MNTAKQENLKYQRSGQAQVPVSLQLHPENDKDIIDWLRTKSSKQATIKELIRAAIARECEATPDGNLPEGHDETLATLHEWLGGMKTYLDERFSALPTAAQIDQLMRAAPLRPSEPVSEAIKPELKIAIKKSMKQGLKLEG